MSKYSIPSFSSSICCADISDGADSPGIADLVFVPPFHFEWEWHNDLPPIISTVDRVTGELDLVGNVVGDGRSDVHAGVGVALTTDVQRGVIGRCLRRTQHTYFLSVVGFGGSTTVEGGIELTVFEDGNPLPFARDRRFRRRLDSDVEQLGPNGWELGDPIEVVWVMRPGRVYTFNVGGWASCEGQHGFTVVLDNEANARLLSQLLALTVFFD